uniref:VWFD domain-containing protein n=1 Tax=Globodera pallida TaxID=36090 RepID=A0A183BZ61_GLOPA
MERILFNPKENIDYEFIYGVPINQNGVQKYLLGHIPINKKDKCTVKLLGSNDSVVEIDTNGNFEIELKFKQPLVYEADRLSQKNYYLDFESSLKVEPLNPKLFTIEDPNLLLISGNTIGVQIHFMESRIETEINRSVLCSSEMKKDQKNVIIIRGNVVNLPDIDCAWKIKVELFKSEPRANSSQQLSLITSPKPKKFQHILTYPTLAPKSNEPDNSYRYNFGKIDYSESAMAKEKESMVKLYNAYLNIAKAKSTYNMVNSVVENVVAYKLSLQMVRMRMIKDIKE